ncbi:hypothetical protein H6503_01865 [Candidatus Woesearchaeota archaeon]|nr:hypothetical protein [Candidatus Woesearchaeota archaeon]
MILPPGPGSASKYFLVEEEDTTKDTELINGINIYNRDTFSLRSSSPQKTHGCVIVFGERPISTAFHRFTLESLFIKEDGEPFNIEGEISDSIRLMSSTVYFNECEENVPYGIAPYRESATLSAITIETNKEGKFRYVQHPHPLHKLISQKSLMYSDNHHATKDNLIAFLAKYI